VGVHDHIDGDVARVHDQGDCTDFRHHSDSTIADQLFRIRIKELAGCEFFVASILLASAQGEGHSIICAGARRKMRGTPNQSVEQVSADFSVFSPECF